MSEPSRGGARSRRDAIAAVAADPSQTAILCDFDGTLAPIVDDPARARALPGAIAVLARLAEHFAVVAVVSGRPAAFLVEQLGGDGGRVAVAGLYGLEQGRHQQGGGWEVTTHPDAGAWEPVVAAAAEEAARAAPAGVLVENKGLALTVHWRTAPQHEEWVKAWVAGAASRSGLVIHPAKASAELRLPVARDKGSVVQELAAGMGAVCFVGDDVGDLPAVEALRRLAVPTVAVVVASAETPAVLLDAADLLVDGPDGALAFLRQLAAAG